DLAERARHREMLYDIAKFDERCHVAGSSAAVRRKSASLSRRQADLCVPALPSEISAGVVVQPGRAKGQRGAKRQPSGGSPGSGGVPPIGTSSRASDSRSGKALRRPMV